MLVVILNLPHGHYHPALNLKYTNILFANVHADFQNNFDHRSSWKHVYSPPLLDHIQTGTLGMKNSFVTGGGQALNVDP